MDNLTNNSNLQEYQELINIKKLLLDCFRKWYWFVISVVLCGLIAIFILKSTPSKYAVETSIFLKGNEMGTGGLVLSEPIVFNPMGLTGFSKQIEAEIEIIKSHKLLTKVIDSLNIQTEYFIKKGLIYEELYKESPFLLEYPSTNFADSIQSSVSFSIKKSKKGTYLLDIQSNGVGIQLEKENFSEPVQTPIGDFNIQLKKDIEIGANYMIIVHSKEKLIARYIAEITAKVPNRRASIIVISQKSSCVEKTKDVLNTLVYFYNIDAFLDKNKIAGNTKKFIDERIELVAKELYEIENQVEKHKKENGITDIQTQTKILLENSSEFQKKKISLENQLSIINSVKNILTKEKEFEVVPIDLGIERTLLQTAGQGFSTYTLQNLIVDYNSTVLERQELLKTRDKEDTYLIKLEEEIKVKRQTLLISLTNIGNGLKTSLAEIRQKNKEIEREIENIPGFEREYINLERQRRLKEESYLFLLKKQEEAALTIESSIPSAKTIDVATSSVLPVSPRRLIIIAIAIFIGLFLPLVVILALRYLKNSIDSEKELLQVINAPYLGTIAVNKTTEKIVVTPTATSPISEMFRSVRTNLQFLLGQKETPVIAVTSSIKGEGKTFVAVNAAISLALTKKKTVLIDLDLRNPQVENYFSLTGNNRGAASFLTNHSITLEDIILPTSSSDYLNIIKAGTAQSNPSELLMSERLEKLIKGLRKQYDYIVIDTPPIAVISDAFIINRVVDNTVCVVRENFTKKELLSFINETYTNNRLNNLSVLLNGSEEFKAYGYGNKFV